MRVHVVGVLAAELLGLPVHHVDKAGDAARNIAADDVAGLVGGVEHHAVEQIAHGDLHARHDTRGAGVLLHPLEAVVLRDDHVIQAHAAGVDRLQRQQHRHDLGEAGGGALGVHVVAVEYPARVQIHQHGGLGVEGGRLQRHGTGGGKAHQQAGEKDAGKKSVFFHFVLPFSQEYVIL